MSDSDQRKQDIAKLYSITPLSGDKDTMPLLENVFQIAKTFNGLTQGIRDL